MNESLLRLKREFVRFVSHEIRSPLNVAIAGLEILKADHANVADQGQVSDNDDIESNKIVSADSPDGGGGGDESSTAVTSVLYIDKFRVEQVMRNLVSNAIKFTPESGTIALRFLRIATVDVAVESLHKPIMELQDEAVNKQVNDYLRIEVMDSGAGDHHQ